MAWYQEWFGEDYLELYAHRDPEEARAHVEFVTSLFEDSPRAVLDLACGAGRHTEALRRRGIRALGCDLSLTLLAQSPELPRVGGDMRCLPFAGATFDWVLNFFTSFGYFDQERQNFRVLEEIVRVLRPGGRVLIDLMNRESTLADLREHEVREVKGERVEIRRWWDREQRRIKKKIRIGSPTTSTRTFLESVRTYTREEVAIGMRWAGLEVDGLFGNFQGEPYDHDSERLIVVGHKPA